MTVKPSLREEQHYFELELKRRVKEARKKQAAMAAAEKKRLKELHFMHCPKCGQKLFVENYGEVEIDVCGGCKGLWLDANELDTILEIAPKKSAFQSFLKIIGA